MTNVKYRCSRIDTKGMMPIIESHVFIRRFDSFASSPSELCCPTHPTTVALRVGIE
jgi:hypothetical protein